MKWIVKRSIIGNRLARRKQVMDIAYGLAAEVHLARFALLGSDDRDGSRRQEHALPELHRCHVQQVGQRHTRNAEMAEADNDSFAVRFIRSVATRPVRKGTVR